MPTSQCDPWPCIPLLSSIIWGSHLVTLSCTQASECSIVKLLREGLSTLFMCENICSQSSAAHPTSSALSSSHILSSAAHPTSSALLLIPHPQLCCSSHILSSAAHPTSSALLLIPHPQLCCSSHILSSAAHPTSSAVLLIPHPQL
ncbi:Envelopment polyprotein [Dissostichus eleginoides]|uniref:Envelopment polyprotein n=1 Tax=Dissostichus eleginoides TaxID=100907 RepID=A0AAD9C6I7_DISEL|nr:Envelopment polyprotein [Dissostichus eleginoides]